ncbi:MAG: hypothetical protein JW789_04585 [Candidatus Aenigmarchaeota archaeon]|nr:hypothetical protein [Candidatus Aenigmarchaeota archaeon]
MFSWDVKNLTDYINPVNGEIKIYFEDVNSSSIQNLFSIDYLAINVTVSPLYDLSYVLTNSSGDAQSDGVNVTRSGYLNASALWNLSGVEQSLAWLNASGYVSTYSFPHYDSNDNWTNHTFNFTNYTLCPVAGNVSVRLKAYDEFYQQNFTQETRYFYLWGQSALGSTMLVNASIYDENYTIASGSVYQVSCIVMDANSSAAVPGHNVTFYEDHAFIGSALTNSTGWAGFVHTASSGAGSHDIICNITDDGSVYYTLGGANTTNTTVYYIDDVYPPYFTEDWFEYEGQRLANTSGYYEAPFYRNVTLVVNASDNTTYVTSVIAEVTHNAGTHINHTLAEGGDGLWRMDFDNSDATMSLNASLTFHFYYQDAGGNWNNTNVVGPGGSLSPNWTMHINLTSWNSSAVYNRGENLTFFASDIHWFAFDEANWSLNVSKYNQTGSNLFTGGTQGYFNYSVNATDPLGNWSLLVNTSWMDNNGTADFTFNVTDQLSVAFTSPAGTVFQPSQSISPIVTVKNVRGGIVPWNVTVNVSCNGGEYMTLLRSGNSYIMNASDNSHTCTAPGSYSASFSISANVTCPYNNSNVLETLSLSTVSEGGGSNPPGSSGSTVYIPPACNCTEWKDVDCGSGNCTEDEMYQERVCVPSGCEAEARCIAVSECRDRKNFQITSYTEVVEVTQGKNGTALFTVENTGNKDFSLAIKLDHDCCSMFPRFNEFSLPQKTSVSIPIVIHAPLSQEPGEYTMEVKFTEQDFEKTETVRIIVNPNEMIDELSSFRSLLNSLREQIDVLENAGVDVTGLRRQLDELAAAIDSAQRSTIEDDLNAFGAMLDSIQSVSDSVNESLLPVKLQGFFYMSWYMFAAILMAALVEVYLLRQFMLPPVINEGRIRRLRGKLDDITSAKKDTLRKYSNRKIDEKSFGTLSEKYSSETSMVNSEIIRLEEEKRNALSSGPSFSGFARWLLHRKTEEEKKRETSSKSKAKNTKMMDFQKKYLDAKKRQEEMDRR